jgi:hypothetical protein
MIANSAIYRNGSRLHVDVKPDDLEGIRKAVRSGQPGEFVSVGLHEPDDAEMARVAKIFGLHRLAVEDSLHPVQRPKVETYGDMVFLVLKTLSYVKESDTIKGGQVALFMAPDYVVTVRQAADSSSKACAITWKRTPMCSSRVPPLSSTPSLTASWMSTSRSSRLWRTSRRRGGLRVLAEAGRRLQTNLRAQPRAGHAAPGYQPAADPDATIRSRGDQGCFRGRQCSPGSTG